MNLTAKTQGYNSRRWCAFALPQLTQLDKPQATMRFLHGCETLGLLMIIGTDDRIDMADTFIVVDKDLEPDRYEKTIMLLMRTSEAQQIINHLKKQIKESSGISFIHIRAGKRNPKGGNPITGE